MHVQFRDALFWKCKQDPRIPSELTPTSEWSGLVSVDAKAAWDSAPLGACKHGDIWRKTPFDSSLKETVSHKSRYQILGTNPGHDLLQFYMRLHLKHVSIQRKM